MNNNEEIREFREIVAGLDISNVSTERIKLVVAKIREQFLVLRNDKYRRGMDDMVREKSAI